jgi:hypothetical protein
MTFANALRVERESMNWSREKLALVIKARCKNGEEPIPASTIKAIELELISSPSNGKRALLCKIFPKLSNII